MASLRAAAAYFCLLVACYPATAEERVQVISCNEWGDELLVPGFLMKPSGDGPFPAVVLLCGCGGLGDNPDGRNVRAWASRLVEWGYVSLQVDSFTPRGTRSICEDRSVPGGVVAQDAFFAKAFLSELPFVDPKNIAVIGWSTGGGAVLHAVSRLLRNSEIAPFTCAIAFYPYCTSTPNPDTPLLVMIGRKDRGSSASLCEYAQKSGGYLGSKYEFSLVVYPEASHLFDVEGVKMDYQGEHMEYDPDAAADASIKTKAFLTKYLILK
jgi:dienelactone hydrolase